IWREENLQVRRKRRRKRTGRRSPGNILAAYPNHVWAIDFEFDQTRRGRQLKIANMVDEFTHEGIAGHVAYSIDAQKLVNMLEGIVAERGLPTYLRCDNGPEFISRALARWCRTRRMRRTNALAPARRAEPQWRLPPTSPTPGRNEPPRGPQNGHGGGTGPGVRRGEH